MAQDLISGPSMDGLLILDKPSGPTSFALVDRVRRLCRIRRVGHAGTLDPLASGILLILLGQATRIARYLEPLPKEYRAVIKLGVATDTDDAEGRIISQAEVPLLSRAEVASRLKRYIGEIEQIPPLYSALKKNGQPFYRLARKGQKELPKPRMVRIHRLELLDFNGQEVELDIACSRGTYVRALARDLGRELGCGGMLAWLRRTAVGPFGVENATAWQGLDREKIESASLTIDQALAFMPAVELDQDEARAIGQGRPVRAAAQEAEGVAIRLRRGGRLLAIGKKIEGQIRPECVLNLSAR